MQKLTDSHLQRCYIGLTQWQHSAWHETVLARGKKQHILNAYTRHFSSVEGNSTFYGLPKVETIEQWRTESTEQFKFCFKFPQSITHQHQLRHCETETTEFLHRLNPLGDKLGLLCIQLPERFDHNALPDLSLFLESLPSAFEYTVEIRNLCFFDKADTEKAFNQLLLKHNVNRSTFDTRALFADPASDPISLKAKSHKPQLPVHAIATGNSPMVRFISAQKWTDSTCYLEPWINKAIRWMDEGKTPYFFFHTPDNAEAPELANYYVNLLEQHRPDCCLFSPWQQPKSQSTLF